VSVAAARDDGRTARRRPTLRRVLATTLVGVALLSMLVAGAYNFVLARSVITDTVERQLNDHQAGKVRALRGGLDRVEGMMAVAARDRGTVDALGRLSTGYADVEGRSGLPTATQDQAVEDYYSQLATDPDGPSAAELVPDDPAGRYLQYHYVVTNELPGGRRAELSEVPADDTAYGRAHADVNPELAELGSSLGAEDLLLIDDSGTVVYTMEKRPDFATDLRSGPYGDTALADAVTEGLARAGVDQTIWVDVEPYLPAGDRPVLFAATAVNDGARVIGAIVAEIPAAVINDLTTNGESWQRDGLGDTGEVYIVGADRLLRSDARLWLEDPDAYLEALDDAGYPPELGAAIADAGTTIGLQPAESTLVDDAFDGQRVVDRSEDYLGASTLTVAGPLGFTGLDWVVVADLATAEADAPLSALELRLLVTALIVAPLVAASAFLLADRISRPIHPVVDGAAAVAGGDLDTDVAAHGPTPNRGLGRRLNLLTADLREQRAAREEQQDAIEELLHSALPARIAEQLRSGELTLADITDNATVVALTLHGLTGATGLSDDELVELSARLSRDLERAADRFGVERIRSASDHHLFAAGLGSPEAATEQAADFVLAVEDALAGATRETGVRLGYRAALSSGSVVAGLLNPDSLTYGVFGAPVRAALALAAVATDGQVLLDPTVVAQLGPEWTVEPVRGLVDLRGDVVDAAVLRGRHGDPSATPRAPTDDDVDAPLPPHR
jgi:class 3 adenylate cyclase